MKLSNKLRVLFFFGFGLFGAIIGTAIISAHGGDSSKIHACVKNTLINGPNIRIVGANGFCNNNETALDWNIQGLQGVPGPTGLPGQNGSSFINCNECTLVDLQLRYDVPTSRNHNFDNALLDFFYVPDVNFSGSTFVNARIRGGSFQNTNLSDTNWSGAKLGAGYIAGSTNPTDFSNADLTGANLLNADLNHDNLTSANFTNANLTNTDLRYSFGMESAILTGVIWSNTTCPDVTNSDDNSNTCEGHLIR